MYFNKITTYAACLLSRDFMSSCNVLDAGCDSELKNVKTLFPISLAFLRLSPQMSKFSFSLYTNKYQYKDV